MENVLILGARGMLGGQLRGLYPTATGWDIEDLNVLDFDALRARVEALAPEAIINCVAFNDVDGAEDRPEQALALNAEFPGELARLAAARGIPLVHYSTNYVSTASRANTRRPMRPRRCRLTGGRSWAANRRWPRRAAAATSSARR